MTLCEFSIHKADAVLRPEIPEQLPGIEDYHWIVARVTHEGHEPHHDVSLARSYKLYLTVKGMVRDVERELEAARVTVLFSVSFAFGPGVSESDKEMLKSLLEEVCP